jgi:hypothetical protein
MQWGFGKLQANGADEGDEGWLTIRYRKSYRHYLGPLGYGDIPLLITECGLDGTLQPRPGPHKAKGWRDFEKFWLDEANRESESWIAHQDINAVMLATSLAPDGFLEI